LAFWLETAYSRPLFGEFLGNIFTLSNAKAKLTVSMPIGRLSTTVWVEGAQAQEGTTQNCKENGI